MTSTDRTHAKPLRCVTLHTQGRVPVPALKLDGGLTLAVYRNGLFHLREGDREMAGIASEAPATTLGVRMQKLTAYDVVTKLHERCKDDAAYIASCYVKQRCEIGATVKVVLAVRSPFRLLFAPDAEDFVHIDLLAHDLPKTESRKRDRVEDAEAGPSKKNKRV